MNEQSMNELHHVVILGGGFGGLSAAHTLRRAPVSITLIDRKNHHLFQPLLYQVATGALSPANIASPLRGILSSQKNAEVLLGEAVDLDVERRAVILADGDRVSYDSLIVATGARHHYFGKAWDEAAPGLKTIDDATEIRRRVLGAFEAAEREDEAEKIQALLTFVIVGAGPTGVELAGAIAEVARYTLRHDFRRIDPATARILLVEGTDRVLPPYSPELSAKAEAALRRLGVEVMTRTLVTEIGPDHVIARRDEENVRLDCHTVLWAAGVQASRLGKILEQRAGATLDRAGRVIVEADLTIAGHPEIFVVGDLAHYAPPEGGVLPGVAPVAKQQGKYATRVIRARLSGRERELKPFRYRDFGSMATIGRGAAVAEVGRLRFSGFIAWLMWLFVHLMNIVEFENRVQVFLQWAWNYVTRNRSARLITGTSPLIRPGPTAAGEREEPVEGARE